MMFLDNDVSMSLEQGLGPRFEALGHRSQVESDVVTDDGFGFPAEGRRLFAEGYLFLDWFAIPQITARASGVNEDMVRSEAAKAVQSIPAYVAWSCLEPFKWDLRRLRIT